MTLENNVTGANDIQLLRMCNVGNADDHFDQWTIGSTDKRRTTETIENMTQERKYNRKHLVCPSVRLSVRLSACKSVPDCLSI